MLRVESLRRKHKEKEKGVNMVYICIIYTSINTFVVKVEKVLQRLTWKEKKEEKERT